MKLHKTLLFVTILLLIYPTNASSQQEKQAVTINSEKSKRLQDEPEKDNPIQLKKLEPPPRNAETLERVRKAAEQGDAAAQFNLGRAYLYGNVVPRDYAEAAKWFRKAAEQGNPGAQYNLGMMYRLGNGVPRDSKEAEKWIRKAVEQGYPVSPPIGGRGGGLSNADQLKRIQINAERGDDAAQFRLGLKYLNGTDGVPQDYTESEKWFRKAAEQGHSVAQFNLGMFYLQGTGVARNYTEAARWFRRASDQDETSAQCMLGALYIEGWGVPKDYIQAYKWLALAVTGPSSSQAPFFQKAKDMASSLAEKMTSIQLEEALELVEQWEDEHVNIAENGVYLAGRNVTNPIVLNSPDPPYTEQARDIRAEGIVVLKCIVRKNGTVDACKILRGLGYGLDESAIRTIAQEWRFKPANYKGQSVDFQVDIEIAFKIY